MKLSIKFFSAAISVFLISMVFFLIAESSYAAKKKDNDNKGDPYVMTEIQLQSWLMSFSDRFATVLINSFERFEELGSTPKIRRYVLRDTVYAIASALTIASEPNPETALLDMVTLTTLARIIYEDNRTKFGEPIEEMILGFRNLETDIWGIAAQILTKEQQSELRKIILEWRKSHPNQKYFSHLRFSEFGTKRHDSKLVKKGETGVLFKSVQKATQQVEELRMLAERGMFLGSRLPILAGMFGDACAYRVSSIEHPKPLSQTAPALRQLLPHVRRHLLPLSSKQSANHHFEQPALKLRARPMSGDQKEVLLPQLKVFLQFPRNRQPTYGWVDCCR